MFRARVMTRTMTARIHGLLYQASSLASFCSVMPHTMPRSSESGLGWVTRETPIVTTRHTIQAQNARAMDAPTELSSEMRYRMRPVAVPATSPVNPPQPVERLQNMPRPAEQELEDYGHRV